MERVGGWARKGGVDKEREWARKGGVDICSWLVDMVGRSLRNEPRIFDNAVMISKVTL